jgi:hypothetical protein
MERDAGMQPAGVDVLADERLARIQDPHALFGEQDEPLAETCSRRGALPVVHAGIPTRPSSCGWICRSRTG